MHPGKEDGNENIISIWKSIWGIGRGCFIQWLLAYFFSKIKVSIGAENFSVTESCPNHLTKISAVYFYSSISWCTYQYPIPKNV